MSSLKIVASMLCLTFAILFVSKANVEAGHHRHHHCHRSNVSINIGASAPAYIVRSPAYTPVYYAPQPVVSYPVYEPAYAPQPMYVAYPQPVYQPVYIERQPSLFTGFSFGCFFR